MIGFKLILSLLCFTAVTAQPLPPLRSAPVIIERSGSNARVCPTEIALQAAKANMTEETRRAIQNIPCGGPSWVRIANLDMTDATQRCPSPWVEYATPSRSCSVATAPGCQGVTFLGLGTYSRVCGRVTGYSSGSNDAFAAGGNDINGVYLDGASLTYGMPRQHIWTFGAGHGGDNPRCPCDSIDRAFASLPPSFVGDNYFCDGSYNGATWDGEGCTSACCTFNSPPFFHAALPTPTSDDIEFRICTDQARGNEAVHIELIQLYVQ